MVINRSFSDQLKQVNLTGLFQIKSNKKCMKITLCEFAHRPDTKKQTQYCLYKPNPLQTYSPYVSI